MNMPVATRNPVAASTDPAPVRDPRLAQSGSSEPSVDGIKLSGEPSMIKTITGINHGTGQTAQGELMFGKTDSGKPLFWLKGKDTNYVLRGADGKPLTNLMDAEARAGKLISGGGATQLRSVKSALGGTEVKAPDSDGKLRINLEDPSLNSKAGSGVLKDGIFSQGERGSKLTSNEAVQAFESQGVPVKVFNSNPEGHARNARMGAMVELPDNAQGGAQYARATAIPGGYQPDAVTYSVPKGASAEFRRGYEDAKVEISKGQVGQAVQNAAAGYIGAKGAAGNRPSVNARPITTELVQPQKPAGTPPVASATPPTRTLRSAAASPAVRQNVPPTTSLQQAQRSEVNRATNQAPYKPGGPITGSIGVRPGINLGKLGEYKLKSLDTIAKEQGIPREELRAVVLVRHGESEANRTGKFAGNLVGQRIVVNGRVNGGWQYTDNQIPLSKLGEQQAREAGPLIAQLRDAYPITSAHVSPVKRAQDTLNLATEGQPRVAKTVTDNELAERGMGGYIGQDKLKNRPLDVQDITPGNGPQTGMVGPNKTPPSVPVETTAEGARPTPKRPIEDRTGYEDWGTFNGRIKSSFNKDILPDLINGGVLQVSHQYSIAAQLKRIDPRIDTASLGHGIPNGQPLVLMVRVQPQDKGAPKLTVVEAGYYRGNPASSAPSSSNNH